MTQKPIPFQVALGIVILVGALVRLIFFSGVVWGDSLNYAHAANLLSQGNLQLGEWAGVTRVGIIGPLSLIYALFGPSQLSTLVYPFLMSLLTGFFLFKIGCLVASESVGLIAVLLWAFQPLDILMATALLPDGLVSTLLTGALYFLLKGLERKTLFSADNRWALLLILLAILVKPIAIMGLIGAGALWVQARWTMISEFASKKLPLTGSRLGRWAWPSLGILTVLAALWYAHIQPYPFLATLSKTSSDLSLLFFSGFTELDLFGFRLEFTSLLLFVSPLYLISVVWALRVGNLRINRILLWLAVLFFYYEWGTVNPNLSFYVPPQPFFEARNFLFLLPSILLICALYLDEFLSQRISPQLIVGISLLGLTSAWLLRDVVWDHIPFWLSAAALALPVAAIASVPAILHSSRVKLGTGIVLLSLVVLAGLRPASPYHSSRFQERRELIDLLREASHVLSDGSSEPILVQNHINAMRLNYASNFELGFDWYDLGLETAPRIVTRQIEIKRDHYLLVYDETLLPDQGTLVSIHKGDTGQQVILWDVP